jgi:hypothetical protein
LPSLQNWLWGIAIWLQFPSYLLTRQKNQFLYFGPIHQKHGLILIIRIPKIGGLLDLFQRRVFRILLISETLKDILLVLQLFSEKFI